MSLETHSKIRNRVYTRKFDHDEALRLRAENPSLWTYGKLAARYQVSEEAVRRVCDPVRRASSNAQSLAWVRRKKAPCINGCGRMVWTHQKGRTGLCQVCLGASRYSSDIRKHELRCRRCAEWKPDSEFGKGKSRSRRYKRTFCRACSTEVRREFRKTHPEQEKKTANRYYHEVKREKRGVTMEYIVLKSDGNGTYEELRKIEAPSADVAIERVVEDEGSYVAVLSNRFEVVTVAPIRSLRVVRESEGPDSK